MKNASLSVASKKENLSSIWGIAQLGVLFFQTQSSGAFISISGGGESERKDCIVLKSMSCQQEDPSILTGTLLKS